MARTESALRCLGALSRGMLCTGAATAIEGAQLFSAAQARLPALLAAGGTHGIQQAFATTCCPGSCATQPLGSSFAALSLQPTRQPAPLARLAHFSAETQPDQVAVIEWVNGDWSPRRPPSIGSIAKYGDEDINLTENIILTPTREADKLISPPANTDPLRADSVRRKRKHKMNKHKHKKRRKLQRHKN